ncbi:MAG: cytochrome c peroxidase, partial [Gammaproteobacteria bacterium]
MRFQYVLSIGLATLLAAASAGGKESADQDSGPLPLGLPPVPIPGGNPQTPVKIALGEKLFHDKRFSADGTVSCANCHNEKLAFT